jgi:DNA-binding NtrC family response regulator
MRIIGMNRRTFVSSILFALPTLALEGAPFQLGSPASLKRLSVAGSPIPRPRPRVLIVDDEAMIRESLSLILTQFGHWDTLGAATSEEALSTAQEHKLNLVTSDICRPGKLNGLEFLRVFNDRHPFIPVVIISGNSSEDINLRALRGGAFAFLPKPFTAGELLRTANASLFARTAYARAMRAVLCETSRAGI